MQSSQRHTAHTHTRIFDMPPTHLFDFRQGNRRHHERWVKADPRTADDSLARIVVLEHITMLVTTTAGILKHKLKSATLRRGIELLLKYHGASVNFICELNHPAFLGLNRPYRLKPYRGKQPPTIAREADGTVSHRRVMIRLREPNTGIPLDMKQVVRVLIHELTHANASHVVWKDDDHGPDFQFHNDFLAQVWETVRLSQPPAPPRHPALAHHKVLALWNTAIA